MKKNFWKRSIAVPLVAAMLLSQCHIVFAANPDSAVSESQTVSEEEQTAALQAKMLATISSVQEESIQADDRATIAIKRRNDNISSIDNYFKEKQAERMQASSSENTELIIPETPIQNPEQTVSPASSTEEEDELVPTNNLIPKYYISGNNDSIISTSTGDLVRIEKIVDLPVAGDITMLLNLKYDSSTPAYSGDATIEGSLRATPFYGVAAGWGFDIPYIDIVYSTLYIPELGTFELNSSKGKVYFNNVEIKYLSFRRTGKNINVYTKNGVTYRFWDGKIQTVTDKHGNYVSYSFNSNNQLSGITDSLGRSITITYNDQANGDVTITLPNTQTIVLDRERLKVNLATGFSCYVTILPEVKRSVGNGTCVLSQYEYTYANSLTNDGYVPAILMSYAVNTQYGANYYYYEATPSGPYSLTTGYPLPTPFRIKENNIVDSDGYTVDWIYYDYEGSPTGYTSDTNTSDIPETYTYSVHVHGNDSSTKYEYTVTAPKQDADGNTIYYEDRVKSYTQKRYDNYTAPTNSNSESYYKLTEYTYTEAMSYPSTIVTTYPGLNNATLTEKYVYDEYKNTVMYLSPKSPTTDHTSASAAPYKTIYTYSEPYTANAARGLTDTVTYNMLLSSQYMTDANTTVKTTNTLSADNKSVASVVTTVNNVAKDRVDYTYDSKGNVLTEKKYPDISDTETYYLTEYAYTYDPYLEKIVITDNSTDIFTQAEYDIMGNTLSAKDADGYITRYEYDGIGRVT